MNVAVRPCPSAFSNLLAVFAKNRSGTPVGIYSVCTSHPLALEAAMRQAIADNSVTLIESTANQVNQYGGYTGMKPADFPPYIHTIADKTGLPRERIVFGGDHLGPLCWANEAPDTAMKKACQLVSEYVAAGYQKIHLDTSMACAGDAEPLDDEVVATRAAMLCESAESAASAHGHSALPVYVIGTEVPVPGGATDGLGELSVTPVGRAAKTLESHKQAFHRAGLSAAWDRVVALVVQPGVEFSHNDIYRYRPDDAQDLSAAILQYPGLVYEAHSTDYQPRQAYQDLVRDHFAILKVGPQLTFALREALFALAAIETELVAPVRQSNLLDVAERVMVSEPEHWIHHYPDSEPEGRLYRRYSYSDRIRYYWPHPQMQQAVEVLMNNLKAQPIPLPLLHQYLPRSCNAVIEGGLAPNPHDLAVHHIMTVTSKYSEACRNNG